MRIRCSYTATTTAAYLLAWRSLSSYTTTTTSAFTVRPLTTFRELGTISLSFHSASASASSSLPPPTTTHPPLQHQLRMASSAADTSAALGIARNVELVRSNMAAAAASAGVDPSTVRLVAVSKTKPLALLQDAYDNAQVRVFGENYVQELVEKVTALNNNYPDIQWHFIGQLQSNKVNLLLRPFLSSDDNDSTTSVGQLVVETVSTLKLAKKLNNALENYATTAANASGGDLPKLRIFVQVNTSGEASKGGVSSSSSSSSDTDTAAMDDSNGDDEHKELVALCQAIVSQCPRLQLLGLMTIGAPNDVTCLDRLVECRERVASSLGLDSVGQLELSMGMSGDYEVAIQKGATNVRVGSTIFGARDYSNVNKA